MRLKFCTVIFIAIFSFTQNIQAFEAFNLYKVREQKKEIQQKMFEINSVAEKHLLKMEESKKRVAEIQKEVQPLEDEYVKSLEELKEVDVHFKHRMTTIYKKGETRYLATLLSAPSIQEFLSRLMVIRLITKEDYKLVEERRAVADKVAKRKKVFDDKIAEVQKVIEEGKMAYLELQKELDKDQKGLDFVERIEEEHFDEVVKINLKDWSTGKLRFPYVGPLSYPIKTSNLNETSQWGYRVDPFTRRSCLHAGIDFAHPYGTPVYAAADGVVVSSRASSGYGWLITVYHGEINGKSLFTRYAHSYPNQVRAVVGQQVYKGKTQLTSIGSNGFSTGNHLHFEVRIGKGENPPSVNPKKWLRK